MYTTRSYCILNRESHWLLHMDILTSTSASLNSERTFWHITTSSWILPGSDYLADLFRSTLSNPITICSLEDAPYKRLISEYDNDHSFLPGLQQHTIIPAKHALLPHNNYRPTYIFSFSASQAPEAESMICLNGTYGYLL